MAKHENDATYPDGTTDRMTEALNVFADAAATPARGFQVPTCKCGHAVGDHKSGGGAFSLHAPPRRGVCRECDCREYDGP